MTIVAQRVQKQSVCPRGWVWFFVFCCFVPVASDGIGDDSKKAVSQSAEKDLEAREEAAGFEEQESRSLAFVEQHHPELVALLQLLKSMKHAEYKTAIRDIAKVRKKIEMLEKRDAPMAAVELDSWKIQSQIDLFLAKA